MPATTEICTINLVAGSDIGNPDNHASHILHECGDSLTQQDGMQQMQFGLGVENPQVLSLFINWDSKGHHEQFMASADYKGFRNRFDTIFEGSPDIVHVDMQPEGGLAAALSSPVTEVATFYFDGDGPPQNAHQGVEKALNALKAEGHILQGWAYGTTYETIEKDGVKGKGAVLAIGWESVDAHMEARKGQAFKDNIDALRNGAKAIEMHHVQFMNFISSS